MALIGIKRRAVLGAIIAMAFSSSVCAQDANSLFREALRRDMEGGAQATQAAFELYRRAAEAGLPEAQFNVASMLDTGRGVAADTGGAAAWYARAASHGVKRAAYNLGQLYEAGQGVPRNLDVARAWYEASKLPAARGRLQIMAQPVRPTGALSAPRLVWPSPDTRLPMGSAIELVWTSLQQPEPIWFYVEVRLESTLVTEEIFANFVTTTSSNIAPRRPGSYRWRVLAVARDAGRYEVSDWATFRIETSHP